MCGIVGYVGKKEAAPVLLKGLKRLEYRGYDSAGIATLSDGRIGVCKRKGRVEELGPCALKGRLGIGHTRWATHGAPSPENAHPHLYGKFAVVHNGIIENHASLRAECEGRGEIFLSETDSETAAHLLQFYYEGDPLEALRKTAARLTGSYALAVLCSDFPDRVLVAREKSPLVVGRGEAGLYVASDIPALAGECEEIYVLADGEFAELKDGGIVFYDRLGGKIEKEKISCNANADFPELGGYPHFMCKEMAEIPAAIANSLFDIPSDFRFSALCEVLCHAEYIRIVACGTAYHSGVAAKYAIERLARVPVEVTVASEFRYLDPVMPRGVLTIAVSQSGETADTIAAAKLAKERGSALLAVTNAPYSSLTHISDFTLVTGAGREIAVAATKSFNAQLAALYSLAAALAKSRGKGDCPGLRLLPALSEQAVSRIGEMKAFAPLFAGAGNACFIGRGADYCAALEGSLKLKEISYLPCEGYPAGELKHGTLALIEEGTPVVAVLTQSALAEKTMNAVAEVYARGGKVLLVTSMPEYGARREVAHCVAVPKCDEAFSPILSVIPLQALAYYTALARGNDPDKPRNLAKSVTVE